MAAGFGAFIAAGLVALLGLPGRLSDPPPVAGISQAPALDRPFSSTGFWNSPIRAQAKPGALSRALAKQEHLTGAWINTTNYSAPVFVVPAKQDTVRVQIDHPPSPNRDALQREMATVPIPAGARPGGGTDARMVVWQPSTDTMWELWRMRRRGGWHAGWGAKISGVSRLRGVNPFPFGATASGLPLAGGLITMDDIRSGSIDHVLALGIPAPRAGVFVAPANRTDGRFTGPNSIPEGTRFRLDPTLDVKSLGLSRVATMIARAAQRYGMVVRDGSEVVTFYAQDPTPTGSNPWLAWFGGKSAARALAGFPWDRLQVVPPTAG